MRLMTPSDPSYHLPTYRVEDIGDFTPSADDPERIYWMSIGDGMTLQFLVNMAPGSDRQEIRVGLHSAKSRKIRPGHFFSPLQKMRSAGAPFVLFHDPTLTIRPRHLLAWFIGTPRVNPDPIMEAVVRTVMAVTGKHYTVFDGSSSGGFVAMRLASRFSHGIAIPRIPQTDVLRYQFVGEIKNALSAGWQDVPYEDLIGRYANRFRVIDLYTDPRWNRGNLISYVHNVGDVEHTESMLTPMLAELGLGPDGFLGLDGRLTVSRPYGGMGHVPVPIELWAPQTAHDVARLIKAKPIRLDTPAEAPFVEPEGFIRSPEVERLRAAQVARHTFRGWDAPGSDTQPPVSG